MGGMTLHQVRRRRFLGLRLGRRFLDLAIAVLAKTWWVATAAVLLVGAAVRYDLVIENNLGPLTGTAEVAAGGEADFFATDSVFYAYPNTSYAGIDLAVIDARIVPRYQTGAPIAIVELGVRNQTGLQSRLPTKLFQLVGPNGVHIDLDRFEYTEHTSRMVVESGQTARGLAVFQLAAAASENLADYHLQIAETGRWPASVLLDSSVTPPANPYPQPLEASAAGERLEFDGLTIELTEATQALEYGVYRAPIGRHLAVVTLEITGSPTDAAAAVDRQLWTLVDSKFGGNRNVISQSENRAIRVISGPTPSAAVAAEATSTAPGASGPSGTVAPRTTVTMQLVFSYSTESSRLALRIGDPADRKTVAEFEVQAVE